jgi:hypothetical protein
MACCVRCRSDTVTGPLLALHQVAMAEVVAALVGAGAAMTLTAGHPGTCLQEIDPLEGTFPAGAQVLLAGGNQVGCMSAQHQHRRHHCAGRAGACGSQQPQQPEQLPQGVWKCS